MKKTKIIVAVAVVLIISVTACILIPNFSRTNTDNQDLFKYEKKQNNIVVSKDDDYELEQVLIVSRHNIRSPLSGGLALANSAVDALKLQIYEEKDLDKALFGHKLTAKELQKICKIGDMYQEICEGAKALAMQVMNPMLCEMKKELQTSNRKFTFLCGHDSTLTALVSALDIKEYNLPNAISQKAPIGSKMVFEKYKAKNKKEFVKVYMCYNTADQLRNSTITSLATPPMFYELKFDGLSQNKDGYYAFDDIMAKFDEAISHYYDYYDKNLKDAA